MNDRVDTISPTDGAVFGTMAYHSRLFRLLSSQSCRYTLYYFLASQHPSATLEDLTEGIRCIAGHASRRPALLDDDRLGSLLVAKALPDLERMGAIEYDPRSRTVRYCSQPTIEEFAEHAAYQELSDSFVREQL